MDGLGYTVGDSIAQFVEEKNGAMGMILGVVKEILTDRIKYEAKGNEDIPDGTEFTVTVDYYETLM